MPRKDLYGKAAVVATNVRERVSKGLPVNLTQEHRKAGYSEESAKVQKAKRTNVWDRIMKPLIKQIENERARLLEAMANEDLSKVQYRDKSNALEKLTKQQQLLDGKATENVEYRITVGGEESTPQVTDTTAESVETRSEGLDKPQETETQPSTETSESETVEKETETEATA